MYMKKCAICGREFEAEKGNRKYCSEDCRIEGKKAARQDWIIRTDYNAKKRHAMELYRAHITEEQYQAQRKKEKNRRAALKRKATMRANREEKELQEKAAAGDPYSRQVIARRNKDALGYWQAWADGVIAYEKQFSKRYGQYVVNGISVNEPDFAKKVVESQKTSDRTVITFVWDRERG